MKKFDFYTLANGVKVLLVPSPDNFSAYFAVAMETGSMDEEPKEAGLAHFLEHLHFDGTINHPNAIALQEAFDLFGADNNGFTNYYSTVYHSTSAAASFLSVANLVTETFFDSLFLAKDIAREKKVVGEEAKRAWDNPDTFAHFKLMNLMYGDLPAGRPVLGRAELITKFNRRQLVAFKAKHYVPARTLVVVAGNFSEPEIKNFIAERFGLWSATETKLRKNNLALYQELKFSGPKLACFAKDIDQIKLRLGFPAPLAGEADEEVADLISVFLTGGLSSRLYKLIRYKLGAAYGVSSWCDSQNTHGSFVISGGFDHHKIEVVLKAIFQELRRLKTEKISEAELSLVKTKMTSWFLLGLETSEDLANFYGRQIIKGEKIITPEELELKIKDITADDIMRVAKRIFRLENLFLVAVGRDLDQAIFAKQTKL